MNIPGKRVKVPKWIHARTCVLHLEVDAIIPDADPSEPCLEPKTVRMLDDMQRLADEGKIDELAKAGDVYVLRRSA